MTRALCEAEAFEGRTVESMRRRRQHHRWRGRGRRPRRGDGPARPWPPLSARRARPLRPASPAWSLARRQHPVEFPLWSPPGRGKRLEERFLELALDRARSRVALFLLSGWINGAERGRWLETTPLYRIYLIGPRPSCPPGHLIAAGEKPGNGTGDYAWLVWLKGYQGAPTVQWLRRDG